MKKGFEISQVFGFGWQTFKENALFLLGIYLVTTILSLFFAGISNSDAAPLILKLLVIVMNIGVSMGLLNITLRLAREKSASFSDFFAPFPRFFPFLFGNILFGLIVLAGMILLVFPAFIWGMQFMFFAYFIIDHKKGPVKALKASSQITYGYKWKLLSFCLLSLLLNSLGLLCFGIGLLITLPVTWLATARIYVLLNHD